jgi:hypothetical protein
VYQASLISLHFENILRKDRGFLVTKLTDLKERFKSHTDLTQQVSQTAILPQDPSDDLRESKLQSLETALKDCEVQILQLQAAKAKGSEMEVQMLRLQQLLIDGQEVLTKEKMRSDCFQETLSKQLEEFENLNDVLKQGRYQLEQAEIRISELEGELLEERSLNLELKQLKRANFEDLTAKLAEADKVGSICGTL